MKKSSKSVWSRFVMTFAATFLLMLVTTVPVKADSSVPLVADMKQTDASTTSAGISWSCPGSEVRFKVEMSEQMSSGYWTYKESQSSASITLTKLGAGKVYYVRITPFKYNIEGLNKYTKVKGTTSRPLRVVTAPDSTPASLTHVKSSTDTIKVKWSAVPGADVYQVVYSQSGTANEFTKETTGTSVTLKNLSKDARYTIKVRAGKKYTDGTGRAWGNYHTKYDVPVKSTKVEGIKVSGYYQNLSKISITNKAKACADGYRKVDHIYVDTRNHNICSTYIHDLKPGSSYYVRIYSVDSSGKKKYSEPLEVVTEPEGKIENLKYEWKKSNSVKLSWDKVSGANVYKVRYYKDNDEYIKYTTKNSLTLKNLKKGEGYSTRVEPMRQSESGFHVESNNAGEGKIYIE